MNVIKVVAAVFGTIVAVGVWSDLQVSEPGASAPQVPDASASQVQDDIDRLYRLGISAVNTGYVTTYDVRGYNGTLDLSISSLNPGDARTVADAMCAHSQQKFGAEWQRIWKVQVFILTSSQHPAAVCQL